ncbi:MAG TPA: hypothetical protein VG869_14795 [Acidimicrobiia bacterium]|nr:hypothetical protein [Acidimicrobiia bacterium]
MSPFVAAGAGFLLAVLWFDLMFDVQVRGRRDGEVPDAALASIAAYYRRVTTDARPMNRLVASVMVLTVGAIAVQLADGDAPTWVAATSLGLASAPIVVAAVHTVPSAVRLGTEADGRSERSRLARSICRDHVLCITSIASLLALQLAAGS